VDDIDMRITDVVRGDDHVNNTPRQINIYKALGADVPHFAHLPMILDEHGAKLSKRTGAADVMQYRDAGYLPHALLNYLVRLGWSHGDQEGFSIAEMQSLFDLADVNAKASRLDPAKLGWLNQQYLKSDDPEAIARHLVWHLEQCGYDLANGPKPADIVVALRERAQTLKDMAEKSAVWFQPLAQYDEAAVAKHLTAAARAPLEDAKSRLSALPEWNVEAVSAALHAIPEALGVGMGKVAQPLRVAVTGTQVSPDIGWTVYLCGRDQALARIDAALAKLPAGA
jgi:glutamyl-tRNA synthetase